MQTSTEQDQRKNNSGVADPHNYFLKAGYILLNREDTVIRTVLGNAVSVTIFDKQKRLGGINHFILPGTKDRRNATPQYGNVAVTALCRMMFETGSDTNHLQAQIIGGASDNYYKNDRLGERNIQVARTVLKKFNIPVMSEDVGGFRGRKLVYHSGTNETLVYKVDELREFDWFLPESDLRYN